MLRRKSGNSASHGTLEAILKNVDATKGVALVVIRIRSAADDTQRKVVYRAAAGLIWRIEDALRLIFGASTAHDDGRGRKKEDVRRTRSDSYRKTVNQYRKF